MPVSDSLVKTSLYQRLVYQCGRYSDGSLSLTALPAMVELACEAFGKILDRAVASFPDYTLHDSDHALRVTKLMGKLLGDDGIDSLNPIETAALILSAFAHDTGMAVSRVQREQLEQTDGYRDFILRNENAWAEIQEALAAGNRKRSEYLESKLFQDYLRARHHVLSAELIESRFHDDLKIGEHSLAKIVARLCKSHGESVMSAASLPESPFAIDFTVDTPFLACVLRLADYLDLDATRAPASLQSLIGIENEESIREWRKHQAANFFVSHHAIRFEAEFTDFFQEKALRDTIKGIDAERVEIMNVLGTREKGKKTLSLTSPIETGQITSKGYIFHEFRFQLEYREIITLLMGVKLYRDERVFVRELLQNALDACRVSDSTVRPGDGRAANGKIHCELRAEEGGKRWVFEVSDNGSGMTKAIVRDFFMRIGRSYYNSYAFRRRELKFEPVSQFGIGVLSCFMKADHVEVDTIPDPLVHLELDPDERRGLHLDIRGPHEYFVVRPLEGGEHGPGFRQGTTLRLFLREPLKEHPSDLVSRYLLRTPYEVTVKREAERVRVVPQRYFDFSGVPFEGTFISMPEAFGYASRDVTFDERFGFGIHGVIRMFLLDDGSRRMLNLRNRGKYASVGFSVNGDTLVNLSLITDEVRSAASDRLRSIRHLGLNGGATLLEDLGLICDRSERLLEELGHRHDSKELQAQWRAIDGLVDAVLQSKEARIWAGFPRLQRLLSDLHHDFEAFVTGNLVLDEPPGILSQDGIDMTSFIGFPERLKLGLGFMYNLDVCGKHKVSLRAARDELIVDEKLHAFIANLHSRVGKEIGAWFAEERLPKDQITDYLKRCPDVLRSAVSEGLSAGAGR